MNEFDKLYEAYASRKITRTERYPKDMDFSKKFLDSLKDEYARLGEEINSKNFHKNFLKAISFWIDSMEEELPKETEEELEGLKDMEDDLDDMEDELEEMEDEDEDEDDEFFHPMEEL